MEGPGAAEPRVWAPFSSPRNLPGQDNHTGARSRSSLVVSVRCWSSLMDCQFLLPLLQALRCRKEHNAALKGLVWTSVENGSVVLTGELESVLTHSGTEFSDLRQPWLMRGDCSGEGFAQPDLPSLLSVPVSKYQRGGEASSRRFREKLDVLHNACGSGWEEGASAYDLVISCGGNS